MSATSLLEQFTSECESQRRVLADAESAFRARVLRSETRQAVAELLHLQLIARFEQFLSDLFYDCVLGASDIEEVHTVLDLPDRETADLVLYSVGRKREKYLSWLPIDDSIGRAEAYLVEGRPFSRLKFRPTELAQLESCQVIRNAIAHDSEHSRRMLLDLAARRNVQCSRPADLLLSDRLGNLEIDLIFASVLLIARGLAAEDEVVADALLNPERTFLGSSRATPAGKFRCMQCSAERVDHPGGRLGTCRDCGQGVECAECGRALGVSEWKRVLQVP